MFSVGSIFPIGTVSSVLVSEEHNAKMVLAITSFVMVNLRMIVSMLLAETRVPRNPCGIPIPSEAVCELPRA
jgi:hypothetical protein